LLVLFLESSCLFIKSELLYTLITLSAISKCSLTVKPFSLECFKLLFISFMLFFVKTADLPLLFLNVLFKYLFVFRSNSFRHLAAVPPFETNLPFSSLGCSSGSKVLSSFFFGRRGVSLSGVLDCELLLGHVGVYVLFCQRCEVDRGETDVSYCRIYERAVLHAVYVVE